MTRRRSDELAAVDEVQPLVDMFNELEHGQRLIFLDLIDPLPEEPEPTTKKKPKKAGKKSASGIRCQAELVSGATCSMTASHGIHDPEQASNYVESHEFLAKKSKRQISLSGAIQRAGKARMNDDGDGERCAVMRGDGEVCELLPDHNIHHLQNQPLYHEFNAGKSVAPTTPTAPRRSSANGGAGSTTANIETDSVAAGVAAEGSSE